MEKKTNKEIDWEERRFELIKAALTGAMAAAPANKNNFLNAAVANGIVGMAKKVADKMIRSLQKELEETSEKINN